MFRIRRVYDNVQERDRDAIDQAQAILRSMFPGIDDATVESLPESLRNPLADSFRSSLFIAEDWRNKVKGFALLRHAADLNFLYLDFISTAEGKTSGGIGGALYEQARREAQALGTIGIFFECLPDDPAACSLPEYAVQNVARLRFYERYGAFPLVNTGYETPLTPGGRDAPVLVYDDLGQNRPLSRAEARGIVRAILERRYSAVCSPEYIDRVVDSIRDDPVRLRPPRHTRATTAIRRRLTSPEAAIGLVVSEGHHIHHIRERGYVESPVRVSAILSELEKTDFFVRAERLHYPEEHITAVHDAEFIEYFKRMCAKLGPNESVYPYVFPIRNIARPPVDLAVRAGYYCIDTFTPLTRNAWTAAKEAADCALTAADLILSGLWMAYALVRPPGHHAERRSFGGFCYLNSAAIAAHHLSSHGAVAIIDVDYHHGNGQQDIFYERSDVLTISLHGHPGFAYPYFSGFEDERGNGDGLGFNVNLPLPEAMNGAEYLGALESALKTVRDFDPRFLIVSLGLDPAKGDPTGTWSLGAADFEQNGAAIGALGLPTLVVQEGGYRTRSLGINARRFFTGLSAAGRYARTQSPAH